jgi:tight adherence protein C
MLVSIFSLPLLASLIGALAVALLFAGVAALNSSSELRQRMELYNPSQPASIEQQTLAQPFGERIIRPLLQRAVRLFSWVLPNKRIDGLRHRLLLAGNPSGITTADFIGLKGWTTIILAGVVGCYLYLLGGELNLLTILLGCVFVAIGFVLPDVWLSRQIARRRRLLTNALPDALDMMTIGVEAGLSFEQAVAEITSRWDHALAREFRRVLHEIGIGRSRREALEHLSERTGVADVVSFVTAVNHAEELGASLARVLSVQSQELRIRRRQRAQENANKVPIKILFPMVFLIFPAMFAVILGPGVPRLLSALGVVISR